MDVKASADGIVESVETSEETGRTVSISIGDGFTVVYGQLKDVSVSKGDMVSEGQVLGKIAEPTKYYKEEGTNLYFQVKENKTAVNPMLRLNECAEYIKNNTFIIWQGTSFCATINAI